jgi:hypothetical protein
MSTGGSCNAENNRILLISRLPDGNKERFQRWQHAKSHPMNVILSEAKNL